MDRGTVISHTFPELYASGVTASSGNTTVLTPTSGKRLRVFYLSYNPASAVEVAFRFGASGPLFLRNNLTQGGSVIAKDCGPVRCLEGAVDESLILYLSGAVSTVWNVFYLEV